MSSGTPAGASAIGSIIATRLREERAHAGLSLAELARRAGLAKSTLSQLEASSGNPSVETLWALAGALGIAVGRLLEAPTASVTVVRADDAPVVSSDQAAFAAALLGATTPNLRADIYYVRADPGGVRSSDAHQRGTVEHVVLTRGRARVGPSDAPVTVRPGDYVSYPADAPHIFEALHADTRAVMLSESR